MQRDLSVHTGTAASPVEHGLRALVWSGVSVIGFVAAFVVVGVLMSQLEQAFTFSHSVMLGLWALSWVPVTGLATMGAARITLGAWPNVPALAWLVLLLGAVVSAAHVWIVADWSIARFGFNDPDFVGSTFLLFAVVAGVAVAGFGVQLAPLWAAWLPLLALVGGGALAVSIIASNIPGLRDGLAADSGTLAAATGAAAAYIGAVGIVSLARLRRG
jgi:hypothetical protein